MVSSYELIVLVDRRATGPTPPPPVLVLESSSYTTLPWSSTRLTGPPGCSHPRLVLIIYSLSEFWVLDMRALSALMFGLRCPVPRGHVLGYIRAHVLVIVPLRVCSGPQQTR